MSNDDFTHPPVPCSAVEVVEAVLTYYMWEGHGVTIQQIADLEARLYDEVAEVFEHELAELSRLGLEKEDDVMVSSAAVWEPTKQLLSRVARKHIDGWTSRRIRALIIDTAPVR